MRQGPSSGPEASWHITAPIHAIDLSYHHLWCHIQSTQSTSWPTLTPGFAQGQTTEGEWDSSAAWVVVSWGWGSSPGSVSLQAAQEEVRNRAPEMGWCCKNPDLRSCLLCLFLVKISGLGSLEEWPSKVLIRVALIWIYESVTSQNSMARFTLPLIAWIKHMKEIWDKIKLKIIDTEAEGTMGKVTQHWVTRLSWVQQ